MRKPHPHQPVHRVGLNGFTAEQVSAINTVKTYIAEHYTEPLSVAIVSKQVYYSPFHFERLFTQYNNGVTLERYWMHTRLGHARRLLRTTDWQVSRIGCDVGYTSIGTFSARFKTEYGMNPSEYRRRQTQRDNSPFWYNSLMRCV